MADARVVSRVDARSRKLASSVRGRADGANMVRPGFLPHAASSGTGVAGKPGSRETSASMAPMTARAT